MEDDDISVQVAVRIRPQSAREVVDMCQICTTVVPGEPQITLGKDVSFTYNHVFEPDADQTTVFNSCVAGLVDASLLGYNSTIFAYGQTGSGKTYTMGSGFDVDLNADQIGMIPRAINRLFDNIASYRKNAKENGLIEPEFGVTAQFIELYNEEIIDLLEPSVGKDKFYKIHEDINGAIEVKGVTSKVVTSADEALKCLRLGALSRTTASTKMNAQSSRSHAVYTLHVKQQRIMSYDNFDEVETLTAKVNFVDLAGSERLKRTGATGERAKEGISINCGLLALGNVISALGDKTKRALHVPYRDSKLTRLLQDSLGGNSRTVMIACISPSDCDFMETLNTLKYSNRARNIKNKIVANRDKTSNIILQLKKQVAELQKEIVEYKQGKRLIAEDGSESVNDMFYENNMLQVEVNNLRTRIKAMQNTVDSLTEKNSKLLAEKVIGSIATGENVDSDIGFMIQSYLKEIEELGAKLIESNSMCEHLRQKNARYRLASRSETVFTDNETELLESAKVSLQREKDIFEQNIRPNDFQPDSEFDKNDYIMLPTDTNMKEELLTLNEGIDMKQKLIDELELTQKRLHAMRQHYEDKLVQLQQRIRNTQEERDKVFHLYHNRSEPTDKIKSVKEEYAKKLSNMQKEVVKLQAAQKEHARLLRTQGNYEQQLTSYKNELTQMKRTKVNLINKMKEESQKHREAEIRRTREIAQLRKESRKKENVIKSMEAEMTLREKILKRKQEEVSFLRKHQAGARGSSPTFLNGVAKKKWLNLERAITNIAWTNKGLVEKEIRMERLLEKRELLRRELLGFERRREMALSKDQDVNHLDNYIEDIKENINYVQELISELQYSIVEVESIQDTNDHQAVNNIVKTINDIKEAKYLINKLYNMTLSQSHMVAQSDAKLKETEASLLEIQQEHVVTGQLLDHVLHNEVPLFSHGVGSEGFSDSASSNASTRSSSPVSLRHLDAPNGQQSEAHSSKIRRRTVLPAELLFGLHTEDKAA